MKAASDMLSLLLRPEIDYLNKLGLETKNHLQIPGVYIINSCWSQNFKVFQKTMAKGFNRSLRVDGWSGSRPNAKSITKIMSSTFNGLQIV